MLALFWLAPAAAALPTWEDLLAVEHSPVHSASFAPDGRGLLWQEHDEDEIIVHLRWFPEGSEVEPLRLPRPLEGRVVLNWVRPTVPHVHRVDAGDHQHWLHGPSGWEAHDGRGLRLSSPFAAAPDARVRWEKTGKKRYDAVRSVGDEVTDRWSVRFRPGDRVVWDAEGQLRAVGRKTSRGHRYADLR